MKKFNLKLIAAALITTMFIPVGAVSAANKPNGNNKSNEAKISQQYKTTNENEENDKVDEKQSSSKWDWKIVKEKAKAEVKTEKENAKAEWKITKEETKAEVKKTREEVKKALKAQKVVITQNNDKLHELKEDIIDQKKEVTEVIGYIKKNNITISDDISKQIQDRLEMIKADIEAINSSKGTINNIYVDIKAQLEQKDANAVQTGVENVLSIQDQRYLSLQKLHDDLQVLLNLLNNAKEAPQTQTPVPGTTTTAPAAGTSTDGQATTPAAGSETSTQTGTSTEANTQPAASTSVDSTTSPSQTTETQNPATGS
jgi:hypothetical protein